jgi:hypothetical protein
MMKDNPFEEIKKIMELREKGVISESEAAEMLAIVEQQYQTKNTSEKIEEKPKSFKDDDEPTKLSEEPDEFIIEIQEEKPKVFGEDDEKKSSSDHRNEKPKNFDYDEPKINKYSNESKTIISNKFVYLIAGFGLIFICSFFTAVPAIIWDADEDGYHTYLDDECPDVIGTINGCPDQDKDGVPDNIDECPTEKGINNGCPTDSIKNSTDSNQLEIGPQDGTDKLLNGQAIKVPKDSPLIKFTGQHWIRLKNKNYEVSNFEHKDYQPVKSQETVDVLNKYYGLKGVLKQGVTTTTNLKIQPKPITTSKGLTVSEEKELNYLLQKHQTTVLSNDEYRRKIFLMNKRDNH